MPLTALSTLIGGCSMLLSWYVIGTRLAASKNGGSYQANQLHKFFLFMGIFFLIMFAPHTLLRSYPELFPHIMAYAYVIGHFCMYIAFFFVGKMLFSMVPRLQGKEILLYIVAGAAIVGITALNAITMLAGA